MSRLTQLQKTQIFETIDRIPAFKGVGIGYIGGHQCERLRPSSLPEGLQTWIVLEEITAAQADLIQHEPMVPPQRPSMLASELVDMGLSCTSLLFAGAATVASWGAAPLSGGTSLIVSTITAGATIASAAQCGIGLGRVWNEIANPAQNDYLDSQEWYKTTSDILDGIDLLGSAVQLGKAAQAVLRLRGKTGRPFLDVLKSVSRAERKQLAQDLARYTGQAATRRQFIRLVRSGRFPKLFTQHEVHRGLIEQLLGAVSSGLSIGGSSVSGMVHAFAVHVVQN